MTSAGPDLPASKRLKSNVGAVVAYTAGDELRSSSLPAPTLRLTGHTGSVYAVKYSPNGETLCSTSFDMKCLLWSHTESYTNFNTLEGHKNAVLDLAWIDNESLVTCSADKTLQLWDVNTGQRIRKWQHDGIVNAVDTPTGASFSSPNYIVSASDDKTIRLWDARQKRPIAKLENDFPVTSVAASTDFFYSGGIDNLVTAWDVKMQRRAYDMKGHTDTITCLSLHPEGTHLLSNSMDHTLRQWDIRPFVTSKRHVKTFTGHKHNAEKGLLKCSWSSGGQMVSCGSADRNVHIWDELSGEELYLLPGHKGCVNDVTFHPTENVVVSASSDKTMFVGELS